MTVERAGDNDGRSVTSRRAQADQQAQRAYVGRDGTKYVSPKVMAAREWLQDQQDRSASEALDRAMRPAD